jgi:hypothetical protein
VSSLAALLHTAKSSSRSSREAACPRMSLRCAASLECYRSVV